MIERCTDYRRINKWVKAQIVVSSDFFYLMVIKDGKDMGIFTLQPITGYDGPLIHADLGDKCFGKDAKEGGRDAFKWIFENTNYNKIYAASPHDKRHAQFMAVAAGMKCIYKDTANRYYEITSNDIHNLNSRRSS